MSWWDGWVWGGVEAGAALCPLSDVSLYSVSRPTWGLVGASVGTTAPGCSLSAQWVSASPGGDINLT